MRLAILLVVLMAIPTGSPAQKRPPDLALTAEERIRIVQATADSIERYYVDAANATVIAAALRASLNGGPVSQATTALELVPPVNRLLASLGDRHLRFGYQREPQAPEADHPPSEEERAGWLREAADDGFGIHGVQRLDGNIGLLTWTKFHEPGLAGDAAAAAMRLLAGTNALIIDLRESEGGSPEMVTLLVTWFLPEGDPVLISSVENRYQGLTQQVWTLPWVPGPRYTGRDVYVLTGARTFSAGEGLAEHLRRLRGATLIGGTTRGGARMSRWMMVHPNFAVSVSVARHVGAGFDWEGVGLTPDVAVPEAEALRTAHLLALRRLREKATGSDAEARLDEAIERIERP